MSEHGSPESHGVYGGTQREDGKMQEEPSGPASVVNGDGEGSQGVDEQEWAEKTESGGEVA